MLEFTQHAYNLRRQILIFGVLAFFAVSNGGNEVLSNLCTREQSTTNSKSFNFRKFGNASGLEQCVDFCCRDDTCELAIFSRGSHCFGVSCDDPELCHKILDRLLMEDERQLERNPRNTGTKDFIRHTSQVTNPRCPKRFVPSFHVLLFGTSTPREFRKLHQQSDVGAGQCRAQCCKSRDCLLSFIEDEECYGVTGIRAGNNTTKSAQEPTIGLQVAIIDRNKEVSRSLDDDDEDPDDLGSDDSDSTSSNVKHEVATQTQPKPSKTDVKVKASTKLQTSQSRKVSSSTNSPKTKTKGSKFSKNMPTKGSPKYKAHHTTKLHVRHPPIRTNNNSKVSTTKGITKPGIKVLLPSKGVSRRITHSVTKNRTSNPTSIVKLAARHSSTSVKPSKRAGPSKAKYTTKVKPTAKGSRTAETRRGVQRIKTEGYSKVKHDVKHREETTKTIAVRKTTSANSKVLKTVKDNQGKGFKSFVTKRKWYFPRFMESTKEGSSQDYEGSTSRDEDFSGDDEHLDREHNDFSGKDKDSSVDNNYLSGDYKDLSEDGEYLSGDDKGLSGDDKDLMEDNGDFSGDGTDLSENDKGLKGDSDDLQKTNLHVMKPKTYAGLDKEGQARTTIDLVKDLDELGSDEDDSDETNEEHSKLASGKVANVPLEKHVKSAISKTEKNSKKDGNEQIRVHFHPKQSHGKTTKKASNISSSRPLEGKKKVKNVSNIITRPSPSGSKNHSVIASPESATFFKDRAKDRKGSGRKQHHGATASDISLRLNVTTKKNAERNKQFTSSKGMKTKIQDDHKRPKITQEAVATMIHTKPSSHRNSSGQGIKTKDKDRGTETRQWHTSSKLNGIGKHVQTIQKYKHNTNSTNPKLRRNPGKASLSKKTLKVVSVTHQAKTIPKSTQTGHNKTMVIHPKRKSKSEKDRVPNQKQTQSKDGKSKSESSLEKSTIKADNTDKKYRKSLESGKFQESRSFPSKKKRLKYDHKKPTMLGNDREGSQKERKRTFPNSNSTLEGIGDLMQYAHRKVSVKHKPSVNRHIERYGPTKKKATFDKTTPQQHETTLPKDDYKKYKANRSETMQRKRPSAHPKPYTVQKGRKSLREKKAPFLHPKTESLKKKKNDTLLAHVPLVTAPTAPSHRVLSTSKEHSSSKKNSSSAFHPTFSANPHLSIKETNSSARIHTSSNNALLSIKQRSNTNISDPKSRFLAHFHQDNNGSDGVDFSVKSHKKHHRRRGKQDEAIDVEDLGDADFDIMMSNDIPHKDLPKKKKGKHKHAGKDEEKQHDTKGDDSVKKKKMRKDNSHVKDEDDDAEESEKPSTAHHSTYRHKDKIEDMKKSSSSKHHHHHHRHRHQETNADDDDGRESSNDEDEHKNSEKPSHHHHSKHDKSHNAEQKDSESENHHHIHKKRTHHVKKVENDDSDDDSDNVESKHAKHHHIDAKEDEEKHSRNDDSENDEKNEHHHHHKHKKHSTTPKIKYDDNRWEGKIIPGKVKLTYEEDREKKRHHKHKIQNDDDNTEMTKKHHKRKHPHSDSDEETEVRKRHRHSKERDVHNHNHKDDDDYKRNEKHTRYREEDEEHHTKDEHKKEKQERAEKRTDVNYEVVKKDRHRLVHNEDNDDDDNDKESSKSKHHDKDDDDDDKQNSDHDSREEDNGSGDDNSDDSNDNENTKHSRVVLGEDSESDDEDEDKHSKESHKTHNGHRHANEHKGEDVAYYSDNHKSNSHEEEHKPAFHSRHKQEKHYESHLESNEADDDNERSDEGNNIRNGRKNFKKSFIYHRKKKKQRILRKHHESERGREQENNDNQEKEFHNSHKDRHYKHHGENYQKKMEKYEDRYEPKATHDRDSFRHGESDYERNHDDEHMHDEHKDEQMHDYKKQHQEPEEFLSRGNMKEHMPNVELEEHNYKHFHHKKERHHGGYSSHEDDDNDDQEARKFKDFHSRKHDGPPYRHQDAYEHHFMGDEKPRHDDTDHRTYYNEGRKYVPRHRKKWRWKNRHHFHNQEDFEGTGGSFDSSAWMRDENSDDDRFYGGEGNQEYYRKKHRKHKHRKHRQSYEYWGYRGQNPYYYNYNYHKSPPRYGYYKPQPDVRPPAEWHKQHYGGYDRWKPKATSWYPNKEHWDRKSSWHSSSHSNWPPIQENRPTEYQWHTFYRDHRIENPPKPTPYPREPSHVWRPTNPRWQQPDETQQRFRGNNNWPPDHGQGPRKQFNDWSRNGPSAPLNQDGSKYVPPQQNPTSGLQPWRNPSASKPGGQQQPTGVQSKYYPPAQQKPNGVNNQTRFRPTVRRQYPAAPPPQVPSPTNISQIKNIMDKLNTPPSVVGVQPASNVSTAHQGPANNKNGLPKTNMTDQMQDRNRLNGFFNEENEGKKKSEIVRPANSSQHRQDSRNSSSSANASQHVQQTPPKTTNTPAKLPPHSTQVTNKTTIVHTTPMQTTSNHTSKPTKAAQNSSTTAVPTQTTTTQHTPAGPNFGDVSQPDDSSETGKKHRKHRAPVCDVGKTTDDVTLLRGKRAGNFTNIGDVGDFDMCIKRCCQHQKCDLAFKSAETCFLVACFNKESCQTSPSLDDIFSPRMCFVKRHSRDEEKDAPEQDGDDEWNDKVSPSGIREVCDVEKALGILWKKTVAGRYSAHPCPRGAKGFVKRRCEADSRWLPPDFSECVSNDYQTLYDKSKKLATGADPSPLIRELSQLTTQNIDNSLIFGGDLNRATDIMAAIVQHNGQTELLDMTREDVENFVRASSNLLDMTNQQEWINIQKNKPGTADVLRSMEMFALQAAMRLPREDMADPTITNNIIIKMDRKSAGDDGLTFPDFSNPKISRWDARHDVIALPSSVFERGEVSTASISFKSLPYLLPDSNVSTGLGPNSKVISTVLHPHPQGKITPPVTVVLSHIKRRRGNPKCVFWDYTLNPHRGGAWSSRGCWLAFSNHSHSICQCSHLSNFAVLMDLSSDEVSQKEQKRERTMALMWIGIPVLIVGVIGGLYMSFSWNRKSGMPSTVTRPSAALNEKTGLLGQRVVTSQVREEFPASPSRDLYRALSPGYSPTGDLEWQDEFDFEMEESGDQGFKQMLLPKLQMLQKHLINEFYDVDKMETKTKKLLESKIQQKKEITIADSPIQPDTDHSVHRETSQAGTETTADNAVQSERVRTSVDRQLQATQAKPLVKTYSPVKSPALQKFNRQTKTSSSRKLRVRFADESPPGRNLTDEDKERFKRLQRMERRVFVQHLSRWTASSHLNLSE